MRNPVPAGALVVAAGRSRRLGRDKLFLTLLDRPLLGWVLAALQSTPSLSQVVLVVNGGNMEAAQQLAANFPQVCAVCLGGESRQGSVAAGLAQARDWEWVAVLDGARPCVTPDLVGRGLEAARQTGAAVAAVPAVDTMKMVDEAGTVESTPPRHRLWLAQTPQVFRRDILAHAHLHPSTNATDDASMVEALGYRVKVFMGSYDNIKVTNEEDLAVAEAILRRRRET
ncbi:MAG: 2-C-methyl-D-erythritol 4-phosphate cytidylyltransferase [Dehalococcoidia bacterium]|nr:2-C-methyl-D-erythritol 4-phosphate cytidylyltransferase [Dehalococcoidia bacterium]